MLKVLKAKGSLLFIATGMAAGQRAPHAVIHIIPRYENDKINFLKIPEQFKEKDKVKEIYDKIMEFLTKRK